MSNFYSQESGEVYGVQPIPLSEKYIQCRFGGQTRALLNSDRDNSATVSVARVGVCLIGNLNTHSCETIWKPDRGSRADHSSKAGGIERKEPDARTLGSPNVGPQIRFWKIETEPLRHKR